MFVCPVAFCIPGNLPHVLRGKVRFVRGLLGGPCAFTEGADITHSVLPCLSCC